MINLFIVDDHTIVRQGLRQIVAETPDIKVVGEAGDSAEAITKFKENKIDVVILDISMPGRSGLDLIREFKKLKPKIAILFLSMHPEDQYALRAFKSGASGYLTKSRAPEELIEAIRKVAKGGKYVTPSLAEKIALEFEKDLKKPKHESLSNRELEVLKMIATGKTVKIIAKELSVSVNTVSTYRERILQKMEMKSNAEIIRYAINEGLIL